MLDLGLFSQKNIFSFAIFVILKIEYAEISFDHYKRS
jgi:hypothetical protein